MGTGALLGIIFCIDFNFIDNFLALSAVRDWLLNAVTSDVIIVEDCDSFVPWFIQSTVTARRA